jgi:hypothetical protein
MLVRMDQFPPFGVQGDFQGRRSVTSANQQGTLPLGRRGKVGITPHEVHDVAGAS